MSNEQLADVAKKLDKHFDKTGVVLVGMHQELQEQKRRIDQYHEKVEAVTSDLNKRRDEIVSDLRLKAESAVEALSRTSGLVERLNTLASEAEGAISQAQSRLHQSHQELLTEAKDIAERLENDARTFKRDVTELLEAASNAHSLAFSQLTSTAERFKEEYDALFAQLVSTQRNAIQVLEQQIYGVKQEATAHFSSAIEHVKAAFEAALATSIANHTQLVENTDTIFNVALNRLEDRINQHLDAHKRFLKSSYEELELRQQKSDAAFIHLRESTERHQAAQARFAKHTRYIFSGFFSAGLILIAILLLRHGG